MHKVDNGKHYDKAKAIFLLFLGEKAVGTITLSHKRPFYHKDYSWFFKQGQERKFKITDKDQKDCAIELIKQSIKIGKVEDSDSLISVKEECFLKDSIEHVWKY